MHARCCEERRKAGVEMRVIGKVGQAARRRSRRGSSPTFGCTCARSSATAPRAFVGSQSLRKLELDGRREVGVIVTDSRIGARRLQSVFEADWEHGKAAAEAAPVASSRLLPSLR